MDKEISEKFRRGRDERKRAGDFFPVSENGRRFLPVRTLTERAIG
jgi:hypothetical protein